VEAANILLSLGVELEPWDIGVVSCSVVVDGARSDQVFKIADDFAADVAGKVASDKIAGIRQAIRELP